MLSCGGTKVPWRKASWKAAAWPAAQPWALCSFPHLGPLLGAPYGDWWESVPAQSPKSLQNPKDQRELCTAFALLELGFLWRQAVEHVADARVSSLWTMNHSSIAQGETREMPSCCFYLSTVIVCLGLSCFLGLQTVSAKTWKVPGKPGPVGHHRMGGLLAQPFPCPLPLSHSLIPLGWNHALIPVSWGSIKLAG